MSYHCRTILLMLLSKLITDFLAYLEHERHVSPLTLRNYRHYLKRFLEFAGDIDPKKIDLDLIAGYRLYLADFQDSGNGHLKKNTINYFLIALRSFLRFLSSISIKTLDALEVELPEASLRPVEILDQEYLKLLFGLPDVTHKVGLRDRSIMELLFSTGLRVSELRALNRDTINPAFSQFKIIGKGGKVRTVSVSHSAADWLKKYLDLRNDTFNPLFIRFQGKINPEGNGEAMRLTTRSIERIVEKYVKMSGLSIKATPHTLRHTMALDLLKNGSASLLQKRLGLTMLASTRIYTKIRQDQDSADF